jgi:hypothetical protein
VATLNPFADRSTGGEQVWFNNTVQLPPAPLPAASLRSSAQRVQVGATIAFQDGADPGFYVVTVTGSDLEQPISSSFIPAAEAPAHNIEDNNWPIFVVPAGGAAALHQVWLPSIRR